MTVNHLCLVLVNIVTVVISTKTYENDFRYISFHDLHQSSSRFSQQGITSYSQLLFDVARNQVLVGARDALFRLSLPHLQLLENTSWIAPKEKTRLCIEKGQSEENCHNYIKVLLTDGNRVFTCGTNAFSPLCSWRMIEKLSKITELVDGIAKCPHNPLANITALISESGDYYVGGPTDFHGSDAAIYRNYGKQNIIRTKQYDSMWLNEPQFVGSFETDRFVYFFLREAAVEYINCGKIIYSRIARVCKNDQGGRLVLKDNWTTFLKARLNCSISGDYPAYFDEIKSIVYVPETNTVYATFTTPTNNIAGSAICAFNLTAIETAFSGPFKYQHHAGGAWDKHYSEHQDHFACKPSQHNEYVLESSKYHLMDNAVQATTLSPLYVAELERFNYITLDRTVTKSQKTMHILYVATLEGYIKKLTVDPKNYETCVIEIWKPTLAFNSILSMQYLKETDSVYVGTQTELQRISAHHCLRHVSRESCYNAMDPYCGWDELKDSCTTAPDGNPLAKHWTQSPVLSCPILNAPVDGGWSSWSDWEACQLRNSNSFDSTDQCLCQNRQCNNPAPKNGGKTCKGLSTAVTNCTVHGDWTPWSAWSACSATCGAAVKTRRRTCSNPTPSHGGRVCVGQDRSEVMCTENPPCPVSTPPPQDGQWSDWNEWSICTAPCGGGFRNRTRKCDNPLPKYGGQDCSGTDIDYIICNQHSCSEQRRHGTWTPWFVANQSGEHTVEHRFKYSCKGPVQEPSQLKISLYKEEQRICMDGRCSNEKFEEISKWGAWGQWSECSVSCGMGSQVRNRVCEGRGECQGSSTQTKECHKECLPEWTCWTDWSSCSVSCGIGFKKRTRSCSREICEGESIQQEPCEGPPCSSLLGWDDWTVWSLCDENNVQHRQRTCKTSNPNPHICQGSNKETRMCIPEFPNDLNLVRLEMETASSSTGTVIGCLIAGLVVGILCSISIIYFYFRRKKPYLPSSPHYVSAKQNPYITVPLQDLPAKRHGASTSNSLLNNSHNGTIKSNKFYDYDTATLKRNSHSLNNGHMKLDNYYYD